MREEISGLIEWFQRSKRVLPWREQRTPYRVWIAEIMLQQTRAEVVVPFYLRWLDLFPDVEYLAKAEEAQVLKAWEGLGYYQRARNLHVSAKIVLDRYQGRIPDSEERLGQLPGFGPYTIGAVLCFAFGKKVAAVDANVARVLSRWFDIRERIDAPSVRKFLYSKVQALLPDTHPALCMEALIELGALICKPQPLCVQCPLQSSCLAYLKGDPAVLPVKKARISTTKLTREVFIVFHGLEILLRHVEKKEVMRGLYEFPYFSKSDGPKLEKICQWLGSPAILKEELPVVKHAFTRFSAQLYPSVWEVQQKDIVPGYVWHALTSVKNYAFSSGHRQILKMFLAKYGI